MADPVPGSPEHAASMLAKARGITYEDALKQFTAATAAAPSPATGGATAAAKPVRPEHIPEKFWDAEKGAVNTEAMAKSYTELEKKQSGAHTEAATAAAAPGTLPTIEQPPAAVTDPAVARQAAFKAAAAKADGEIRAAGKISDETYKSLADVGYPKDVVDSYVAGQRALQQQYVSQVHKAGGGEEAYNAAVAWAKTNFTPEEIKGFDSALRSGNVGMMQMAVAGLKARFESVAGKSPTTTVQPTNTAAAGATAGYTSRQEMIADMATAKYQKGDPAFHAQVRAKMEAAIRNKVDLGLNIMVSRA